MRLLQLYVEMYVTNVAEPVVLCRPTWMLHDFWSLPGALHSGSGFWPHAQVSSSEGTKTEAI